MDLVAISIGEIQWIRDMQFGYWDSKRLADCGTMPVWEVLRCLELLCFWTYARGCRHPGEGRKVGNQRVLSSALERIRTATVLVVSKGKGQVLYCNDHFPDSKLFEDLGACLSQCRRVIDSFSRAEKESAVSAEVYDTTSGLNFRISVEDIVWASFSKAYLCIIELAEKEEERYRERELMVAGLGKLYSFEAIVDLNEEKYSVLQMDRGYARGLQEKGTLQELVDYRCSIIDPAYREQYLNTFAIDKMKETMRKGRDIVYMEYPCKMWDGEYHWCFTKAIRVDHEGQGIHVVVLSDNIDEKIWVEQEKAEMLKGINFWYNEYVKIDLENARYTAFKLDECENKIPLEGKYEQWYGKYLKELIHPEQRERFKDFASMRALKRHFKEDGQQLRGEFRRLRADNTYEWTEMMMTCIKDPYTGHRKVIFCYEDISERKGNESLIEMLSNHYTAVYQIGLKKWKMKPVRSPENFYELTNKSKDYRKFFARFVEEQVAEESREVVQEMANLEAIKNRFADRNAGKIEMVFKNIQGEWSKLIIVPASYYNEEQSDIIFAIEDYNEEMQNRFNSALYSNTLIQTYESIYKCNPVTGNISRLVFDGEKLAPAENEGTEIEQFLSEAMEKGQKQIPEFELYVGQDNVKSYIKKGIPENIKEFKIKNGKKAQWYQLTFRYFIEDNQEKILILVKNINTVKCKDEFRKKAMLDALQVAESASKAKTDFLSNMSHDIRTPMNAIIGMTNIAKAHMNEPDRVQDCLDKITTASNHLLSLINNILDMSKIESGTVSIDEEEFTLTELIKEIEAIVLPQMKQKRMEFYLDTENLVHDDVLGDTLRIKQVLINIIGNAVKYTNQGGVIRVTLRELSAKSREKGVFEFVCADNGIGMSEEFVQKIFTPFERANNSTISRIEGTGLGMSITKNLIDMMGGTIHVQSALGKGTTITVRLRLKIREPRVRRWNRDAFESLSNHVKEQEQPNMPMDFSGKRLLLVEDNELNMEIAKDLIGMTGMVIDEAWNGEEAVEKMAASKTGYYDLILCDIQMPIMDGYEATKRIRSMDRPDAKTVPIIAMTANAFAEDKVRALETGMNGHISKPIDLNELFTTLDKVLYYEEVRNSNE